MFCEEQFNISNIDLYVLYSFSCKVARLTQEDIRRAEDSIYVMKVLHKFTLCVSAEKSPTCGQILPILKKLKAHLTVQEGDKVFLSNIPLHPVNVCSPLQETLTVQNTHTYCLRRQIRSFSLTRTVPDFIYNPLPIRHSGGLKYNSLVKSALL